MHVEMIDVSSKSWIQVCKIIKNQESKGDYDPREIILELLPAVMAIIDAGGIQFADVEVRDITLGLMAVTADLVFDGELVKYIEIDYPSIN